MEGRAGQNNSSIIQGRGSTADCATGILSNAGFLTSDHLSEIQTFQQMHGPSPLSSASGHPEYGICHFIVQADSSVFQKGTRALSQLALSFCSFCKRRVFGGST